MHALIIETDAMVAMTIEDSLRDMAFSSFAFAVTAREALACARKHRPDIITSGLRLLEGTGVEAVRAICAEQPTPVIFITTTGWVVRDQVEAAVVVQKPFDAAALRRAVERSLNRLPNVLGC
jgi:DNA-binding response OmpR family regulator